MRHQRARSNSPLARAPFARVAAVSLPVRPGEAHLVAQALRRATAPVAQGVAVTDAELDEARALSARRARASSSWSAVRTSPKSPPSSNAPIRLLAERVPAAKFLPALRRANVHGRARHGPCTAPSPRSWLRRASAGSRHARPARSTARGRADARCCCSAAACSATCSTSSAHARRWSAADVVVVTGHGGATLAYADVVLPAAVQHERLGTVTNIEGRVTAVAPKIVRARLGVAGRRHRLGARRGVRTEHRARLGRTGRQDHRRDDGLSGAVGAERRHERRRRSSGDIARAHRRVDRSTRWPFPAFARPNTVGLGANCSARSSMSRRAPRRTVASARDARRARRRTQGRGPARRRLRSSRSTSVGDSTTTASPCRVRRHWPT